MVSRTTILAIAVLDLALFAARSIVAGTILNDTFDGVALTGVNVVTPSLTLTTVILSVIGIAASVAAALHSIEFNAASRFGSVVGIAVVLLLDLLALGMSSKQWQIGGDLGGRAEFLAIACVVQCFINTLYLLMLLFTPVSSRAVEETSVHSHDVKEIGV